MTGRLDFVPKMDDFKVEYESGASTDVTLHDGSMLRLHKLDNSHDVRSADEALVAIRKSAAANEVATGLLYVNDEQRDLHDVLETDGRPLNSIPMAELCPGSAVLDGINKSLA